MKKKVTKVSKSKSTVSRKSKSKTYTHYATEHDFIIIIGGGLVVLLLTVFMLFLT